MISAPEASAEATVLPGMMAGQRVAPSAGCRSASIFSKIVPFWLRRSASYSRQALGHGRRHNANTEPLIARPCRPDQVGQHHDPLR